MKFALRLPSIARAPAAAWLWLVLCVAVWLAAFAPGTVRAAGTAEAERAPVALERRDGGVSLVGRVGYLQEPSTPFGIEQVRQAAREDRFVYPSDPLQGRESRRVLWFKLHVQLADLRDADRDWLLVVPSVSTHEMRFYGPFPDADEAAPVPRAAAAVTGMRHPYETRAAASEKMAFGFRLQDARPHTIYVRVESDFARIYAMTVWKPADYLVATQDKRMFDGICYGVLLAMLIITPPLLLVFRERIYAYYLLSCFFALLSMANFNGHTLRYVFPNWPAAAGFVYVLSPAIWAIVKLAFARRVLDLRTYAPRSDLAVQALIGLLALASLAAVFGFGPYLLFSVQMTVVVATAVMAVAAVAAFRRGYKPAMFYLLSAGMLLAGISVMIIVSWGWLPWAPAQMDVMQVALCAELVVFAIALASRMRLLSQSARRLEVQAQRLQHELSVDGLTGAANRLGFERRAQTLLDAGAPIAVMLMDLNGFKSVNDSAGHAAGDRLLEAVALRLREVLRGTDLVARLGGDEFVLLVSGETERARLHALAQRVLEVVRQPVMHEGRPLAVTGSLGIARSGIDGETLSALVRSADAAMYHCKRHDGGAAFADELLRATAGAAHSDGMALGLAPR